MLSSFARIGALDAHLYEVLCEQKGQGIYGVLKNSYAFATPGEWKEALHAPRPEKETGMVPVEKCHEGQIYGCIKLLPSFFPEGRGGRVTTSIMSPKKTYQAISKDTKLQSGKAGLKEG